MTRTTAVLIALFAMIAAACVAFGAYFAYATLLNANRAAVEARFAITAQRIGATAELASGLGIALPAQQTLPDLLRREARIDTAIRAIDVADERGHVLFSSDPDRAGRDEPAHPADSVSRVMENDLEARIGRVIVHYDPVILAAGAEALAADLRFIAIPTLAAAALATIAVGLLLAASLRRSLRRAADPGSWPEPARAALASVDAAHAAVLKRDASPAGGRP
ncbi:hypothetical protein [Azorhizobium doebereinerae]|uniref:hypothetical protein n=1 Tax=Azorhizobium doebereinerae TaxID=281091 RepID=UPI0003FA3315|nr:hypothetical protein [Azorhizobium doebereinerae]